MSFSVLCQFDQAQRAGTLGRWPLLGNLREARAENAYAQSRDPQVSAPGPSWPAVALNGTLAV